MSLPKYPFSILYFSKQEYEIRLNLYRVLHTLHIHFVFELIPSNFKVVECRFSKRMTSSRHSDVYLR